MVLFPRLFPRFVLFPRFGFKDSMVTVTPSLRREKITIW